MKFKNKIEILRRLTCNDTDHVPPSLAFLHLKTDQDFLFQTNRTQNQLELEALSFVGKINFVSQNKF